MIEYDALIAEAHEHHRVTISLSGDEKYCRRCGLDWPCPTDRLAAELSRLTTLRPIEELREEDGDVLLWWHDGGSTGEWLCYLGDEGSAAAIKASHWTPLPRVREP